MQFAVFGSGSAVNQNLKFILASVDAPDAAGFGVALFALTSSLSRVAVGILSDRFRNSFSRFDWLCLVAGCAVAGQMLTSLMTALAVLLGVLLLGLAFGGFFTVIVPVVNEMYGRRQFGVIMGSQLASQAAAAFLISFGLIPLVYSAAAHGEPVCTGGRCYRASFLSLGLLQVMGFISACVLKCLNKDSLPLSRLDSSRELQSHGSELAIR